jgi:hypothetical protein
MLAIRIEAGLWCSPARWSSLWCPACSPTKALAHQHICRHSRRSQGRWGHGIAAKCYRTTEGGLSKRTEYYCASWTTAFEGLALPLDPCNLRRDVPPAKPLAPFEVLARCAAVSKHGVKLPLSKRTPLLVPDRHVRSWPHLFDPKYEHDQHSRWAENHSEE